MFLLLLTILLPVIVGLALLLWPIAELGVHESPGSDQRKAISFKSLCMITGSVLVLSAVSLLLTLLFVPLNESLTVIRLNDALQIAFRVDKTGRLFSIVMMLVWVMAGFFSFEYMKHEKNNKRYFGIFLMVLGILMGLCFAGNLPTYYTFYEFMTLASFGMVLHNQSHEAIMAGLKYMFYSFAGAYMVLFGIYFVYQYSLDPVMNFKEGGILDMASATAMGALKMAGGEAARGILMLSMLFMVLGFSVKAGMFPMHGWLPTAHPVAPAPASAALSAIIVKAGVLGIIRVIRDVFGYALFEGSFVQEILLTLSLITVFMGSMLAYKEKVLKKRLAYSTVSQVSYILFALFICNADSFKGGMIHVTAHAAIKSCLFLCAGAIIYITGCTRVDELRGIGKRMPVLLWCYTIVSLGLIGIPPFGGFASKWYICMGSLSTKMTVFSWLGPVVLLVSALLTAGYLLPISINGFLPGNTFEKEAEEESKKAEPNVFCRAYIKAKEPGLMMLVPIIVLTFVSVVVGMFPEVVTWLYL